MLMVKLHPKALHNTIVRKVVTHRINRFYVHKKKGRLKANMCVTSKVKYRFSILTGYIFLYVILHTIS